MNTNAAFEAIANLDLAPIKRKLMHAPSGEGWSLEKADKVEREYRRYLCIMKLYPGRVISPTADVDMFWHYHILDTRKYAADCKAAFGYFLHHDPYVGMDGGMGDAACALERIESGERMRALYELTFGEAYPGSPADDPAVAQAWCAGPGQSPIRCDAGKAQSYCAGPHEGHIRTRPAPGMAAAAH